MFHSKIGEEVGVEKMSRTIKKINIRNKSKDELIYFIEKWFLRKNFDILELTDSFIRLERIREMGWICFEFEITENEMSRDIKIEAYVKGAQQYEGREFDLSYESGMVGRIPRKKASEYLSIFIDDIHKYTKNGGIEEEIEDPLLFDRVNQQVPLSNPFWRINQVTTYGLVFFFFLFTIGTIFLLLFLNCSQLIYVNVATILIVLSVPALFMAVVSPVKIGFSQNEIYLKYLFKIKTVRWDEIEEDNGMPKLKWGIIKKNKRKLLLYLKGDSIFEWPLISPRITYEFRSRFIRVRNN